MRRRAKVDANHGEIVEALRKAGATVQSLAAIGKGCPDLLVGFRGTNLLMEVKDGRKVKSARKLTHGEIKWAGAWNGYYCVVSSAEEALAELRERG